MKYNEIKFNEIDSTNLYIKNNWKELSNFTFVTSSYQSNGKGRENRTWESSKGENLLFSLLIKKEDILANFESISLGSAYVVALYLESLGLDNVTIKWPNDVLINDKKICGILLEGEIPNYVVLGIGLNVNQIDFPNNLRRPATSIKSELNKDIDIDEIKKVLFPKLIDYCGNISSFKCDLEGFLQTHNYLLNKEIVKPISGVVIGIDTHNKLLVKNNDLVTELSSGEIEIKI